MLKANELSDEELLGEQADGRRIVREWDKYLIVHCVDDQGVATVTYEYKGRVGQPNVSIWMVPGAEPSPHPPLSLSSSRYS